MPIYEYRCHNCGRRVSILWHTFAAAENSTPRCPRCGSDNLTRLISRVAVVRSEEARLEALADPSTWGGLDENDPRSLARFMRKMTSELGEDLGDLGDEFNEVIDRLEAGQTPEEIEKEMPELAGPEGPESELGGEEI
ncbi:MAG: zinc ribbon domain-containing protein [Chloroflexi bacterium]|nr:MAG: zinc ribbon domain-containing protein [Chloroflexota bacterium]